MSQRTEEENSCSQVCVGGMALLMNFGKAKDKRKKIKFLLHLTEVNNW